MTKQVNRVNGQLKVSQPKTSNSIRTIPIPKQAVDLLILEHEKHPDNPYMFPSPKTGTMYDPDSFRHTHEKILAAAGIEHIRFHDGCIKIGLNQKQPHSKGHTDLVLF